ncbi:MAG: nucleotide exchange factor GrpE [Planctomycetes bacterium]|nr:nucleotide exchange factor GrpE [Planctomycetota bacterium]
MTEHHDISTVPDERPIEERLASALAERDEVHRNWQRALADYQNLRRRLASDVEDAVRRGKRALVTDLLLVLDYLDMALAAPASNPETAALRAGVELTRGQLWSALEKEGVSVVRESGAFDAAWHECAERVATAEAAAGTILRVLRRGYAWQGTVLRPAQVRVAAAPAGESIGQES